MIISVLVLILTMPWACLPMCVIVVLTDHTYIRFYFSFSKADYNSIIGLSYLLEVLTLFHITPIEDGGT